MPTQQKTNEQERLGDEGWIATALTAPSPSAVISAVMENAPLVATSTSSTVAATAQQAISVATALDVAFPELGNVDWGNDAEADAEALVDTSQSVKHLVFQLGEAHYCVPMSLILEITELGQFTPVPHVPDWVLGITNLRGDILSIVDLSALLEDMPHTAQVRRNLLVAQTAQGDLTTCLAIDRVLGVVQINPERIQMIDKISQSPLSVHTRGYYPYDLAGNQMLNILDLEALLHAFELQDH